MPRPILTRRSFLLATAGVAAAAACGGGDDGGATATSPTSTTSAGGSGDGNGEGNGGGKLSVLRYFPDGTIVAGTAQRLVYGIGDAQGVPVEDVPAELAAVISRDGEEVAEVTAVRRAKGVPRPYYAFRTELAEPGLYDITFDLEGTEPSPFTVVETPRLDTPGPGDRMIPVVTPTVADDRGVTPICTAEPVCPLHGMTLTAALEAKRPVAFLISTPAFCQLAVCGPVLDVLLSHRARLGDRVQMLHAEVYVDPEQSLQETTEAVKAYQLPSEPVLFLAGADGVITERLDSIFDEDEVGEALDALLGGGTS